MGALKINKIGITFKNYAPIMPREKSTQALNGMLGLFMFIMRVL